MDPDTYSLLVARAKHVAAVVEDPELQHIAFEKVLAHMIDNYKEGDED